MPVMSDGTPGWATGAMGTMGHGHGHGHDRNPELEILWQQRRKIRKKLFRLNAALMRTEQLIAQERGASRTGNERRAA
jgi:hypothetical protein